jgi:D-alanine-D-alanine ligase
MLDVPYSGAPPGCMAVCYDKAVVRLVAEAHGIPVPREAYIDPEDPLDDLPRDLYPALIKPNRADGSLGITADAVVRSPGEARSYLSWLRNELPGAAALMQEYLPGPEYGVGLIGNPGLGLRALPVMEVDFSGLPEGCTPILCYESKALPGTPYWTDIRYRPTRAGEDVTGPMVGWSKLLFERLRCRDYARFDFRAAADGTPHLMEVNPNPAWASDGKLALMAGFAGIGYPEMLGMILDAARRRVGPPA